MAVVDLMTTTKVLKVVAHLALSRAVLVKFYFS